MRRPIPKQRRMAFNNVHTGLGTRFLTSFSTFLNGTFLNWTTDRPDATLQTTIYESLFP